VLCDVKSEYSNVTNFNINFSDEEISNVDYVILFLGENAYAESPGNIDDLTLDPNQIDLAKRAIALDKKIVLVLIQGNFFLKTFLKYCDFDHEIRIRGKRNR
jgi:beta-glucosidase